MKPTERAAVLQEIIDRAQVLATLAGRIDQEFRSLERDGFPSGGERVSGSRDWTSTERAALFPGIVAKDRQRFDTLISEARGALRLADGIRRRYLEPAEPRTNGPAGTGDCLACGQYCSGAKEDRLRSGFCPSCARAYSRAGCPDRSEFVASRRREVEPA